MARRVIRDLCRGNLRKQFRKALIASAITWNFVCVDTQKKCSFVIKSTNCAAIPQHKHYRVKAHLSIQQILMNISQSFVWSLPTSEENVPAFNTISKLIFVKKNDIREGTLGRFPRLCYLFRYNYTFYWARSRKKNSFEKYEKIFYCS